MTNEQNEIITTIEKMLEMVKSGEIRDGKAVILLQYLQTSGVMNAAQVR